MLGMGLLSRAMMVDRIAGSERWYTKSLYAADSGLHFAMQRARINRTTAFQYNARDMRGSQGLHYAGDIVVTVDELRRVSKPKFISGSQVGGGQGGSEMYLAIIPYKGHSEANQDLTKTHRTVTNIFTIGPVPLGITD
jgi:hypothetical protein